MKVDTIEIQMLWLHVAALIYLEQLKLKVQWKYMYKILKLMC